MQKNIDDNDVFLEYPQSPLRQSWDDSYPFLVYNKGVPDRNELCVIHMAGLYKPRTIILGRWEFVTLVNHRFDSGEFEKCGVTELGDKVRSVKIMLLVKLRESAGYRWMLDAQKKRGDILRLMMIEIDPWNAEWETKGERVPYGNRGRWHW